MVPGDRRNEICGNAKVSLYETKYNRKDAIHKFMGIGIRSPDENTSNNDQFYGYEENN